jgi:hypothetical protein
MLAKKYKEQGLEWRTIVDNCYKITVSPNVKTINAEIAYVSRLCALKDRKARRVRWGIRKRPCVTFPQMQKEVGPNEALSQRLRSRAWRSLLYNPDSCSLGISCHRDNMSSSLHLSKPTRSYVSDSASSLTRIRTYVSIALWRGALKGCPRPIFRQKTWSWPSLPRRTSGCILRCGNAKKPRKRPLWCKGAPCAHFPGGI